MIIDALFGLFRAGVDTVLGWMPESPAPDYSATVSGVDVLWQYAAWANKYAPLSEGVLLTTALLSVWMAVFVIRLTVWALTKAHVLGGSSD